MNTHQKEEELLQKARLSLEKRLEPKGFYGFDPSIVIVVLEVVLQVLKACFPKPPASQVRLKGLGMRMRLRLALRRDVPEFNQLSFFRRNELVDDVIGAVDDYREEEVQEFLDTFV